MQGEKQTYDEIGIEQKILLYIETDSGQYAHTEPESKLALIKST